MFINPVSIFVGIIFSPLAAIMAYLITYGEYQHHYPDKKTPKKIAIEASIGTFIFFMFISLLIGFVLKIIFK